MAEGAHRREGRRSARPHSARPAAPVAGPTGGEPYLQLKVGREKSLLHRHPWIFSGAIASVAGDPQSGSTVSIVGADGQWLAHAAYSATSQIRARVWSFDRADVIDARFFVRAITRAVAARAGMQDGAHSGCRLIHAESDGLPGVIADRYDDVIVLQCLSTGASHWRNDIAAGLVAATGVSCVFERSDAEVRSLEGLPPQVGPVIGALPERVIIHEDGLRYRVDPVHGQKTGFYLDQRDNRRLVRDSSGGKRVLNAFCYSGGFSLAALAGGALGVISIDSSADALHLAAENIALNPALPAAAATWVEADVFADLRRMRNEGVTFDVVVLDPPKFAPTAAHADRASRAYKDINLLALKLLVPGGLLATFSCSGGVSAELFQKIVAGAAVDAHADAQIVQRLGATRDHPVALSFPEGDYLKGLLVRKLR